MSCKQNDVFWEHQQEIKEEEDAENKGFTCPDCEREDVDDEDKLCPVCNANHEDCYYEALKDRDAEFFLYHRKD